MTNKLQLVPAALFLAMAFLATPPASGADAAFPASVTKVAGEKGKTVTVDGNLDTGTVIEDLSWAANSSVACFPGTQNTKFRGKHVLYSAELPSKSIMKITVTPKDPTADLSLYAYSIGKTRFDLPPKLPSCVSCEADHKWDRPKKGKTQDHSRSVELNAIKNPYNVVIGVTGPAAAAGEYTLSIELD